MQMKCPINPVWGRVIVKPDDIHDTDPLFKKAKSAGIALPEAHLKKEQVRQVEGELIAIGGNAFESWKGEIPQVGQRVIFDEYAGSNKTINGIKYQIINDDDIIGIIKEMKGENND